MKNPAPCLAFLLAASALALSSCSFARVVPFNEADFTASRGAGSGSVVGQAYTVPTDGSVRYASNDSLELVPVNAYTTEFMQRTWRDGKRLTPDDPRMSQYVRHARTDALGNFEFRNLPPGAYYAATQVHYSIEEDNYVTNSDGSTSPETDTIDQWQWVYAEVSVSNQRTTSIREWNQGDIGGALLDPLIP